VNRNVTVPVGAPTGRDPPTAPGDSARDQRVMRSNLSKGDHPGLPGPATVFEVLGGAAGRPETPVAVLSTQTTDCHT